MTEDQDAKDSQSDLGSKTFINKNKDKKTKTQRPLTKIIMRRLPPTMTEEAFLDQVSPIPEHDHFYFAKPDPSLGNYVYSRAYINFINVDDIYLFRDKFDGYVFLDEKGVEYFGIVEYAPFQRIPKKKKKKDPKCGTIESDPIYQEFIDSLNNDQETDNQPKLEYSYPVNDSNDKKVQSTPLLEYLAARKQDKRGRDERRRRENDKRKMRIERKTKEIPIKEEEGEIEVKKLKSREWEKDKLAESKEDQIKSEYKDGSVFESKTYRERKTGSSYMADKKKKYDNEKKDNSGKDDDQGDDSDKGYKKEKRDKFKESPREQKSKKYSDTRKERIKSEFVKSEKQSVISKIISSENKSKLNHDDIKPFTQLPQVKTDDLSKIIESMDKKVKLEESKTQQESRDSSDLLLNKIPVLGITKMRRNSLESGELPVKDESLLKRQKSLDDRSKSTDREGSEEKDKSETGENRTERRIRNKDRPSLVIYQPGMGRFSKQRLAKEKDIPPSTTIKSINNSEKKDT